MHALRVSTLINSFRQNFLLSIEEVRAERSSLGNGFKTWSIPHWRVHDIVISVSGAVHLVEIQLASDERLGQ